MGICSVWHVSKWITAEFLFCFKMPSGWFLWLVIVCRGHGSHNHCFPWGSWSLLPNWWRCGETNSASCIQRGLCSGYSVPVFWKPCGREGRLVPEVRLVSVDTRSTSLCISALGERHILRTFFFPILKRERERVDILDKVMDSFQPV